jgi:hypothetical protein
MSYDVAICTEPVPLKDKEAWQAVDSLIDTKGEKPEVFKRLHDRLTERYPCICTLSDDRVDEDGVWSDGPLWNDFGYRAAVLGMVYSRVEEVLPFLVKTPTTLDWLYLTGQDQAFIVRNEKQVRQ